MPNPSSNTSAVLIHEPNFTSIKDSELSLWVKNQVSVRIQMLRDANRWNLSVLDERAERWAYKLRSPFKSDSSGFFVPDVVNQKVELFISEFTNTVQRVREIVQDIDDLETDLYLNGLHYYGSLDNEAETVRLDFAPGMLWDMFWEHIDFETERMSFGWWLELMSVRSLGTDAQAYFRAYPVCGEDCTDGLCSLHRWWSDKCDGELAHRIQECSPHMDVCAQIICIYAEKRLELESETFDVIVGPEDDADAS